MSSRGICPDCHGEYTVKKDGTLHHHVSDVLPAGSIFRSVCPGAGKMPDSTAGLIAGQVAGDA